MADSIFEPEVKRSLVVLQNRVLSRGWSPPPIAIECKRTQSPYLGFAQLKDHQLEGLFQFTSIGHAQKMLVASAPGYTKSRFQGSTPFDYMFTPKGLAYVLVNFRFTKKSPRKDIPKGINRCFALTPDQYKSAKLMFVDEGKASIPYEWFNDYAIECGRIRIDGEGKYHSYGWDLSVLVPKKFHKTI